MDLSMAGVKSSRGGNAQENAKTVNNQRTFIIYYSQRPGVNGMDGERKND